MVRRIALGSQTRSPRSARAILTAPLFGVLLIPTFLTAQPAEFGFTFVTGAEVRWEQIHLNLTMIDGDTVTSIRYRQVIQDSVVSVEPDGSVGLRQISESVRFEMLGFDGVRQSYDSETGGEPAGPMAASMARMVGVPHEQVLDPKTARAFSQLGPRLHALPEGPVDVGHRWRWKPDGPPGSALLASFEAEYTLVGFDEVDGRRVAILEGTLSSGTQPSGLSTMGMPPMPPFSVRAVYDLEKRVLLELVQEVDYQFEVEGELGRVLNRTISRLLP